MRIFQRIHTKLNWSLRRYIAVVIAILLLSLMASGLYHMYKPLPEGLNYTGKLRHAEVEFLSDQSYVDQNKQAQSEQVIFDRMLKMIEDAQSLIVLDMFLFNKEVGESKS